MVEFKRFFEDVIKPWVAGWVSQRLFDKRAYIAARDSIFPKRHVPIVTNSDGYVDLTFINGNAHTEFIADTVGAMVTGNTETAITVTYQDADNTIDFVVNPGSIDHGALAGLADNDHPQYVRKAGDTMTGELIAPSVVVGDGTLGRSITINGAAGAVRIINFQTNGSNRWNFGAESTAESGGNAGSNFRIQSRTDAGAVLETVLEITRSNGNMTHNGVFTTEGLNVGEDTLIVFDDGTYTPVLQAASSNPTVGYAAARYGTYQRSNNKIDFQAYISISSFSGGSGVIRFTLPFTAAGSSSQPQHVSAYVLDGGTVYPCIGQIVGGTSYCEIILQAGVYLSVTHLAANDAVGIGGIYFTA